MGADCASGGCAPEQPPEDPRDPKQKWPYKQLANSDGEPLYRNSYVMSKLREMGDYQFDLSGFDPELESKLEHREVAEDINTQEIEDIEQDWV